ADAIGLVFYPPSPRFVEDLGGVWGDRVWGVGVQTSDAAPLFRCFPFPLPLGRPMFDLNVKNLPL
ncbi:hypothetical protein, partial [Moorena sp. SIO4G3]|uniref:hypothetical protein n=1 Tax=Moorena sp. SIO4G3 TaxID=2607821 RepID=UPI0025D4A3C7